MVENASYFICQDIYIDNLIEFMSKAYGSMMVQYFSYLTTDTAVTKLIADFKKINSEVLDVTNKPYYKWCKEVKKYDVNMSWFVVYLDKDMKYKYLMDLDGFIQAKDLTKYSRFDPLIAKLNFTGSGDQNLTTV
jgi:hypothetical protein